MIMAASTFYSNRFMVTWADMFRLLMGLEIRCSGNRFKLGVMPEKERAT